ncbi:MAG TPA: helix-turn-helix domain-containing protein [Alphaproteobacteria bacterium]|nr:helix-turn-helix domain-containing protein [Alphaproteobacteria bacterium]
MIPSTISSRQIKAARALLDWSQENLADAAALSVATIRKLEVGYISPRHSTTGTIRRAIEAAGLEFIEPNGVRQRTDDVVVYQGADRVAAFHEDILRTLQRNGGELMMVAAGAEAALMQEDDLFRRVLETGSSVGIKCLTVEKLPLPPALPRCECRVISKQIIEPMPFYVYGDKYAMTVPGATPAPKIVVLHSAITAQASRRQFTSMWEKGAAI